MSARAHFDKELENLNIDMLRLGSLTQDAIDNAITALTTQNADLAKQIVEGDKEIDNLEKLVESRALRLLLQQQPVAGDLRTISTALKAITDMERIGDQAADIAEISLRFQGQPFIKDIDHITKMSDIAIDMVHQCISSYVDRNQARAQAVIDRDDEVDELFDVVKMELVRLLKTDDKNADQAIDLLMIAKYLERIADHATNIAEWVIFCITGQHKNAKIL